MDNKGCKKCICCVCCNTCCSYIECDGKQHYISGCMHFDPYFCDDMKEEVMKVTGMSEEECEYAEQMCAFVC